MAWHTPYWLMAHGTWLTDMARRTREEAEQTRLAIMDTAMAVFARHGLAGASLEQVATELGITRGAIYGHFRSKNELFEQVIKLSRDQIYGLLHDAMRHDRPPLDALRQFIGAWLGMLSSDRRFRDSFEILLNKSELTDELSQLYRDEKRMTQDVIVGLSSVVRRAIEGNDLPAGVDAEHCGLTIYTHLMGVTQTWLFNPRLFKLSERMKPITDHLIASLSLTPDSLELPA